MNTQANRILVVDDEVTAGRSIEKVLGKKGFNVDVALSADDGKTGFYVGLNWLF